MNHNEFIFVFVCLLCRETLTQHFLTTCDFLLRWFTFQKKILPHIYQQRRLQVSKKDFFSFLSFQRLIMSSYKHTGNATVLKIQKIIHFQSYRFIDVHKDQNRASIVTLLNAFMCSAIWWFIEGSLWFRFHSIGLWEAKGWLGVTKGSKLPSLSEFL